MSESPEPSFLQRLSQTHPDVDLNLAARMTNADDLEYLKYPIPSLDSFVKELGDLKKDFEAISGKSITLTTSPDSEVKPSLLLSDLLNRIGEHRPGWGDSSGNFSARLSYYGRRVLDITRIILYQLERNRDSIRLQIFQQGQQVDLDNFSIVDGDVLFVNHEPLGDSKVEYKPLGDFKLEHKNGNPARPPGSFQRLSAADTKRYVAFLDAATHLMQGMLRQEFELRSAVSELSRSVREKMNAL